MSAASGLYLLARLDAAASPDGPAGPLDLERLGFGKSGPAATLEYRGATCSLGLVDPEAGALSLWVTPDRRTPDRGTPDRICGFAGYLDEPEALAATLGVPPGLAPARLAAAAITRFGAQAAHRMLGEWELVLWQREPPCVTLLSSRCRRDAVCFRLEDSMLAVAPQPMAVARFFGTPELDPTGLLLHGSRFDLRRILTDETVWKGVHQLAPATQERFTGGRRETTHAAEQGTHPAWEGSFADAVEALQATGRRVLQQHVRRHPGLSFQLSGGQDSTLLACWGAHVAPRPQDMLCLCSAAPAGSGLRDETAVAAAAAAQLGIAFQTVVPPADWSVYRPRAEAFAFTGSPLVAEPQPTARALQEAARQAGSSAMVGGNFGELTVTGGEFNTAARSFLRNRREQLRGWTGRLRQLRQPRRWPQDAFQARFSADILAQTPAEWRSVWKHGAPPWVDGEPGRPIGISPALAKAAREGTAVAPDLRLLLPFRDRRLVEAVAVLPSAYRLHGGQTRALSRALLRGHVPDTVSLRTEKLPFAPDFTRSIERGAPEALGRVAHFEAAGVGGWIDLGWLRLMLSRAAGGQVTRADEMYSLRSTAHTAEFLLWLAEQGISIHHGKASR